MNLSHKHLQTQLSIWFYMDRMAPNNSPSTTYSLSTPQNFPGNTVISLFQLCKTYVCKMYPKESKLISRPNYNPPAECVFPINETQVLLSA